MENNNFRSASHKIEEICSHVDSMTKEFKEQVFGLDFGMPRFFNNAIRESATRFNVEADNSFKLLNEPKEWNLDLLVKNTPDLSIIEVDNEYFIASNSGVLSQFQIAYAFYEIDENIPENILENLDFNSREAKEYFFTQELKDFITSKEFFETEHSQENILSALRQSCVENNSAVRLN
jgi:hypothetical protein